MLLSLSRWIFELMSTLSLNKALVMLFCLAPLSGLVRGETAALMLSLSGTARFQGGDDATWAMPEFDDSRWAEIKVPGSWQEQQAEFINQIGWQRLRFTAQNLPADTPLALSLGYVGNATEVFLKGTPLGRIGSFDPVIQPLPGTLHIYSLPRAVLMPRGTNVLAVRLMNQAGLGGLLGGPIGIGSFAELNRMAARREFFRRQVEWIVQLLLAALLACSVFLMVRGKATRLHAWAAAFSGSQGFMYFLIMTGSNQHPTLDLWLARLGWGLSSFGALAVAFLISEFFHIANPGNLHIRRSLAAAYVPIGMAFFFLGPERAWFSTMSLVYGLFFLMTFGISIGWSIVSWRKAAPGARWITLGLAPMFIGGLLDALSTTAPVFPVALVPFYHWEIGLVFFVLLLGYTLIDQYVRNMDRLNVLSRTVLRERERERQRLARDLHDQVGQSLQALKMMLQLNQKAPPGAALPIKHEEVICKLGDCIKDLRLLAREMHPAASDEISMVQSMQGYARELEKQFGVFCRVESADGDAKLTSEAAAHCFLIFKEAVGNAIRHGRATRIEVAFRQSEGRVLFQVCDNGCGFDRAAMAESERGLGLRSMRERAEWLGGSCHIESRRGHGTRVTVQLPLHQAAITSPSLSGERPTSAPRQFEA
jgi:signal transduction histidine kinase